MARLTRRIRVSFLYIPQLLGFARVVPLKYLLPEHCYLHGLNFSRLKSIYGLMLQ